MLSLNEVKVGTIVRYQDKPYEVQWVEHSKLGRGGAILRSKIKNLEDGTIIDKTFKGNDKLEQLFLDRKKYQYLYKEGDNYFFMDPDNFEQITIDEKNIGEKYKYLKEGVEVEIFFHENKPLAVNLPIKMTFKVEYTEPGLKGDTKSSTALKLAKIDTGYEIRVPLFIKNGDKIVVDTRDGKYVERSQE